MRLVEGDHVERLDYGVCNKTRFGTCTGYDPRTQVASGPVHKIAACMDTYEAPNIAGHRPFVMKSGEEAEAWCKERGKRLCSEYEWELACEGPEKKPFGYGWQADETCNTQRPWKQFNAWLLVAGGKAAEQETERLWQGDLSGARSSCVDKWGVHDLLGNAEEWVTASRKWKYPVVLMGGHWAKHWTTCRGTNWVHEPYFRFYEVGFRCCKDPRK
jgi:formylglycine-generating enzyme required for sulfatase activity